MVISHKLLIPLFTVSTISLKGRKKISLSIKAPLFIVKIVNEISVKINIEKRKDVIMPATFSENDLATAYKGNDTTLRNDATMNESAIDFRIVVAPNAGSYCNIANTDFSMTMTIRNIKVLTRYFSIQEILFFFIIILLKQYTSVCPYDYNSFSSIVPISAENLALSNNPSLNSKKVVSFFRKG